MLFASGFSWFHLIPGVEDGSLFPFAHDHGYIFASAWFACLIVIGFALMARAGLNRALARQGAERYAPESKLSAFVAAEALIGALRNLMLEQMDVKYVRTYLPLVVGLFIYIFTCNILAVFPGFQPPTDNINANAGMATMVFIAFMAAGLLSDPVGFIKHLMGPVLFMAPMMFVIEAIGLIVRPVSLSIRLTGNMFGDHTVFNIMSDLVPLGVPIAFLALATLVSVIQAGVFSLLTIIYISLSLPHGDHDHH